MLNISWKRVACALLFAVFLFISSWTFFEAINLAFQDRIDLYLGAFSVFSGAYVAFLFNQYQEREKESEELKKSLSLALYVVSAQLNVVANLKKRMDEYGHLNAFNMKPSLVIDYPDLRHDSSALSSVLMSNTPYLLGELNLEQQAFELVVAAEKRRSEFVINELQPKFEELGLKYGFVRLPGLEEKIGPRLFYTCVNEFQQLHLLAAETCTGLEKAFSNLREYAVREFPGHPFIKLKVAV
ncbi:hypothetical protein [uncultured Alcanivorax sp.]|uniref:hypothetical protein n=1 Tax=uncultured Alcanivorax sp. TaxID=191215 RepID=UPI00262E9466|nr:hypothetical protein [uncultured Alcanivorax sp.]